MLGIFEQRVEEVILAAMQRGELDDLPGSGKPLPVEEDMLVPEEMRMAYKILKNAGLVPPEIATRRAMEETRKAIRMSRDQAETLKLARKLNYLSMQLDESGQRMAQLMLHESYYNKITARLSGT